MRFSKQPGLTPTSERREINSTIREIATIQREASFGPKAPKFIIINGLHPGATGTNLQLVTWAFLAVLSDTGVARSKEYA
jgi:hypothetical protein